VSSKQSRKRSMNRKTEENTRNNSESPPKPTKKKRFVHPEDCNNSSSSKAEKPQKLEGTQSIDVSDYTYTLSTLCMLGSSQVHVDSDLVKLGEFSFRAYM
jgi:hypothetical protein